MRALETTLQFETFTELHYSQTRSLLSCIASMFETFTELHYSQTPRCMYTKY